MGGGAVIGWTMYAKGWEDTDSLSMVGEVSSEVRISMPSPVRCFKRCIGITGGWSSQWKASVQSMCYLKIVYHVRD